MLRIKLMSALFLALLPGLARAQLPADARAEQQALQEAAQQSQQRVEALDDETRSMVSAYNRELERVAELRAYNENMRRLLENQQLENERINGELEEVERVREAIVPLMVEMVEVLEQFVTLDQPMLVEERSARVEQLKTIINRSDVEIAEKYRRIIEAYLIEAEYGQSLEAYEGSLNIDGREITVDFLRLGRVGLFYLTLDGRNAAIWSPTSSQWVLLPQSTIEGLQQALRVARDQAPPNLLVLPLWTPEAGA